MTRFICLICLFPCVLKGPCYRCPVNFVAQELPTDHKIAQIANTFVSAASIEKNGRQNNSFNFLIVTISAISARKILHNCCTKFCSRPAKDGTVVSKQRTPGHVLNWNYSCFEITTRLGVRRGGWWWHGLWRLSCCCFSCCSKFILCSLCCNMQIIESILYTARRTERDSFVRSSLLAF